MSRSIKFKLTTTKERNYWEKPTRWSKSWKRGSLRIGSYIRVDIEAGESVRSLKECPLQGSEGLVLLTDGEASENFRRYPSGIIAMLDVCLLKVGD